ncbi:hypothetical protein ZIOFF_025379 [Zingiber officinale]|uniref:Uncharacterized protein n=1 Tax=Zingiber officinale TaxID=94328 RepID=A0A8J5H1P6_ZINOF|nr:hypothetical protein ZIOFF_025379 [Zingiber officinale]
MQKLRSYGQVKQGGIAAAPRPKVRARLGQATDPHSIAERRFLVVGVWIREVHFTGFQFPFLIDVDRLLTLVVDGLSMQKLRSYGQVKQGGIAAAPRPKVRARLGQATDPHSIAERARSPNFCGDSAFPASRASRRLAFSKIAAILHPRVLEERREALTSTVTQPSLQVEQADGSPSRRLERSSNPVLPPRVLEQGVKHLEYGKFTCSFGRFLINVGEESVMEEGKIDSSEIKDKNDHVDQDPSTSSVNEVKLPEIGMTFSSEEEVCIFYNSYAQNVGFGICKLGGRNGDDGKQKYFSIGTSLLGLKMYLFLLEHTLVFCSVNSIWNGEPVDCAYTVWTIKIRKQINQEDMERIRYISLFVEYMHTHDMKTDGKKLHYRRVLMDDEHGKTVPNWRPRRLGGGLGTTRTGREEFTQNHSASLDTLHSALNDLLPREIIVREISPVQPQFHARFSTTSKTYHYKIYNHVIMDPFRCLFAYQSAYKLNPVVMREAAAYFVGKHDFSSFANAAHNDWLGNLVKEIFCFDIIETAEVLVKAQQDIGETLGELGLTFVKIAKFETKNATDLSQRRRAVEIKQLGGAGAVAQLVAEIPVPVEVKFLGPPLEQLMLFLARKSEVVFDGQVVAQAYILGCFL